MEYTVLLIVEVLSALGLIGLVLLQQGKGADVGASFGAGASQTIFGSSGSGNFMTRMTGLFATVFFVTSLGLAYVSGKAGRGEGIDFSGVLAPESSQRALPILGASASGDVNEDETELPIMDAGSGAASELPELPDAAGGSQQLGGDALSADEVDEADGGDEGESMKAAEDLAPVEAVAEEEFVEQVGVKPSANGQDASATAEPSPSVE